MKWVDLYKYLSNLANDINNLEDNQHIWQQHVLVQNMETNDIYPANIAFIDNRLIVGIHHGDSNEN